MTEHKDRSKKASNSLYDRYKRSKEAKRFYNSKEWKAIRHKILVRDSYLCQRCLRNKFIVPADLVHHLKELEDHPELSLTENNLESLCHKCHTGHHKKGTRKERNSKADVTMEANEELG